MSDKVLILRSTGPDRKSHGGFQWPESGYVEAPDWDPIRACRAATVCTVCCGVRRNRPDVTWCYGPVWQVVEVDPADIVDVNAPTRCGSGAARSCCRPLIG